jgi:CBS domain-containing protein
MTRNPICVLESALAVEALKIFDERNIDDLIVVNAKQGAGWPDRFPGSA